MSNPGPSTSSSCPSWCVSQHDLPYLPFGAHVGKSVTVGREVWASPVRNSSGNWVSL
jgi:hypothetical protein